MFRITLNARALEISLPPIGLIFIRLAGFTDCLDVQSPKTGVVFRLFRCGQRSFEVSFDGLLVREGNSVECV